jgi:type II secretory pathway component PulF
MTEGIPERDLALALFTRQFATLVDAGFSLVRIMLILEQEAPEPFNAYMPRLRAQVEEGQSLSSRMALRSDLFSPFYITMIRAGEIGGILEETLHYLADYLEEEWKLLRLSGSSQEPPLFFLHPNQPMPQDWADLSAVQRLLTQMVFCRVLSGLLSVGVPIKIVLETVAEMLPLQQREAVRIVAQSGLTESAAAPPLPLPKAQQGRYREQTGSTLRIAEPLATLGFLPALVTQAMSVGEQAGHLDQMMDKVAQFYRYEIEYMLLRSTT